MEIIQNLHGRGLQPFDCRSLENVNEQSDETASHRGFVWRIRMDRDAPINHVGKEKNGRLAFADHANSCVPNLLVFKR